MSLLSTKIIILNSNDKITKLHGAFLLCCTSSHHGFFVLNLMFDTPGLRGLWKDPPCHKKGASEDLVWSLEKGEVSKRERQRQAGRLEEERGSRRSRGGAGGRKVGSRWRKRDGAAEKPAELEVEGGTRDRGRHPQCRQPPAAGHTRLVIKHTSRANKVE